MTATISTQTVIRALRDLHDRQGEWPTKKEVAAYLDASETAVQPCLKDLHGSRLFRPRQRQGRRVWMPWNEP